MMHEVSQALRLLWTPRMAPAMLLLVTLGHAQVNAKTPNKTVVVPRWNPIPEAFEFADSFPAPRPSEMPTRVEYAYDVQDLRVPVGKLSALEFRSRKLQVDDVPAVSVDLAVSLWHAAFVPRRLSTKFAANEGRDRTLVFVGRVNWPWRKSSAPPEFFAKIGFRRPFLFVRNKGKSLVVEIVATKSSLKSNQYWTCAAAQPDRGAVFFNERYSCWLKYQGFYSNSTRRSLEPGGSWEMTWSGLPRSANCLSSIGFKGVGEKWGNLTLPIHVGSGCVWATDSMLFLPFRTDWLGFGKVPKLPIPKDARLAGTHFFDQAMCFTPKLNAVGLVTFFSARFVIGSGSRPNARMLFVQNNAPPKQYGSQFDAAPLIRFTYQ